LPSSVHDLDPEVLKALPIAMRREIEAAYGVFVCVCVCTHMCVCSGCVCVCDCMGVCTHMCVCAVTL
jgi:hypothetical protein